MVFVISVKLKVIMLLHQFVVTVQYAIYSKMILVCLNCLISTEIRSWNVVFLIRNSDFDEYGTQKKVKVFIKHKKCCTGDINLLSF